MHAESAPDVHASALESSINVRAFAVAACCPEHSAAHRWERDVPESNVLMRNPRTPVCTGMPANWKKSVFGKYAFVRAAKRICEEHRNLRHAKCLVITRR
jgi:hypothetical protein